MACTNPRADHVVYCGDMLEQAIEHLTAEVVRLRQIVDRQNALLPSPAPREPERAPAREDGAEVYMNEYAVADLAGMSVATLRRWRLFRAGPPYRKFGSAVRYSRAEVLAWLDGART